MKKKFIFERNKEKNALLKKHRNISFEKIVEEIEKWNLIVIIPHHNQERYSHQKILAVYIDDYIYAVPCVQQWKKCFLKTIYKDRNLTAFYLS